MYLDWLASAMIRLEQFFQYFDNSPHQRAAIQRLQEDMPPELLEHDSEWFEIWKSGGKLVPFKVPYFSQYELKNGYRKCFTTAMAMIAAHYGVIAEHEDYDRVRIKYGDTVEVSAQLKALSEVGLQAEFVRDGTEDLIEAEIDSGRPIAVGWLHKGDISTGRPAEGFGHWAVIIGYTDRFFIVHDPRGEHDIERGKLLKRGEGAGVFYDREDFLHRWQVEGPRTGWAILVDASPPLLFQPATEP